jgi:hypothetical protein
MSRATLSRWGAPITAAAGVTWLATFLSYSLSPDADDWDCNSSYDYATNAVGAFAFLVMAAAFLVLLLLQREHLPTYGKIGFVAALAGSAAAGVNNPIEHCAGVGFLGIAVWVPANLLMLSGSIASGISTVRARVLPVWTGVALAGGVAVGLVTINSIGVALLGFSWLAVAGGVWVQRRPSAGPQISARG